MNDRIKELASQCWDRRLDGMHFDQEKFAELVVRQCIREVEGLEIVVEDGYEQWNRAVAHAGLHLRDHFGVEG